MTAAQRATLETAKGYHAARVFEYRETGETAMADKHQRVADALRAALGTCGTCKWVRHLPDPGFPCDKDARMSVCAHESEAHPLHWCREVDNPDTFGCTGWTAKEGA